MNPDIKSRLRAAAAAGLIASLAFAPGCGCEREQKFVNPDEGEVHFEKGAHDTVVNAFQAYLREIDKQAVLQKIKKNVDPALFNVVVETAQASPWELAYSEGMAYHRVKKLEDAIKCFKRALSYPAVPPEKALEIKFLLMDSLRESGKEPEYLAQLNEYKQKYNELRASNEAEHTRGLQKAAIIHESLKKLGAPVNDP